MRILVALFAVTCTSSVFAQNLVMMPDAVNLRLVTFDPFDGHLVNSNHMGNLVGAAYQAMQVGGEIWISGFESIQRRSLAGGNLGSVSLGNERIARGMALHNGRVYTITNQFGSPVNRVQIFDQSGIIRGEFDPGNQSNGIMVHEGRLLVSHSSGHDIAKFSLGGVSQGPFHDSFNMESPKQMTYDKAGNVLVAVSSNHMGNYRLHPVTGAELEVSNAPFSQGVFELGNGQLLWSNSTGVSIFNPLTGGNTQVYAGKGAFLNLLTPVPEPATLVILGTGLFVLSRRRKMAPQA